MVKGKVNTNTGEQIRINVDNTVPQFIYDNGEVGRLLAEEQAKDKFSPERLKLIMQYKKVTAYRLAKDTGMAVSNMYRIIDGQIPDPQFSTLKRIADYLNISIFDIMTF